MLKRKRTYPAFGVIAAAAGAEMHYQFTHAAIQQQIPPDTRGPPFIGSSVHQDDVKRKTLESIGSIKYLRPVPLPSVPRQ